MGGGVYLVKVTSMGEVIVSSPSGVCRTNSDVGVDCMHNRRVNYRDKISERFCYDW